jgi:importin subunit alpha-6/7
MRRVSWVVSNLCRGKPAPDLDVIRVAFPFLLKRLLSDDIEAKNLVCWALSHILDGDNSRIEVILEAGFLQPIVTILDTEHHERLRTASLRVIGDIVSGNESQTQQVLDCSILKIFRKLLVQTKRLNNKKAICWSISNITAGTPEQLQRIIDSRILTDIITLGLTEETTPDLLTDCAYCICNATDVAVDGQMDILVAISGLEFLLQALPRLPPENLANVLVSIVNILEKKPNAAEPIFDEALKSIPSIALQSDDAGVMARKIIELLPSRFGGVVLSADIAPLVPAAVI